MDATLHDRLVQMEQRFPIAIVAHDEAALEDFYQEWSWLLSHFQAVEASGVLDDSTTLLLSRLSQAIRATTMCMLDCEDIDAQTGGSSLYLPPDDLLTVSTSRPTVTPCHLLFSRVSSSGILSILGQNKLLDACAYRWLMRNTHNPYPTSTRLQFIGDESNTSVAQAELWFQEARDLVGWTKLSLEFFTGSLNATTTIAKRVYLEHDNTVPFHIAFAFFKVKAFTETLFLEESGLPASLANHIGYAARALRCVPTVPIVNDSAHFDDLLDNEEIEDTTPPPSVAGCKRKLLEDIPTSLASDLHRPSKRLRVQSLREVHPRSESTLPLSNTGSSFKKNATEALIHTSAIPATPVQLSEPSFSVVSKPSPDSLTFNSTGPRQIDLYGSASETVVSPDSPVSQGKLPNQQISEGSLLAPFDSSSTNYRRHPSQGSVPTFAWPVPPSLDHPTDSTGASQITVIPGAPVDLCVFDWNSIPNPLVETTISTNQISSGYVPSSDLAALNFELPDLIYLEQLAGTGYNPPCPLNGLGSLEDFSLLQFPIPTTFPPDISASPSALSCLDNNSTFPSPEMDWSAITDFINQVSSFSAESSSAPSPPSAIFDAAPSTPENSICSLLPSPPHEANKPISVLDPSIPPSVFLQAESGIFTEDGSNTWTLF